jgi:hypothetical protein
MKRAADDDNLLGVGLLQPVPQCGSFFIGAADFVSKYDNGRSGTPRPKQDLPRDLGITLREAHFVSRVSFRRRNKNSRSVAVVVHASGLEWASLYPPAKDDDGVRRG